MTSPQPICRSKSTGPRTAAGKRASSKNALQHGLASSTIMMPGEDPAAFEALTRDLAAELKPRNILETILVNKMAEHHWLAHRALRLQAEVLSPEFRKHGHVPASLPVLLRYVATNQNGFQKCLQTLQTMRKEELKAAREFVSQPAYAPARRELIHPQPRAQQPAPQPQTHAVGSARAEFAP